jgi:REP element-mobilizing transposase RayT
VSGLFSLRAARVFPAVRAAITRAQRGDVFRICHFSVQSNHVHLLVGAEDRQALSRGVQGLAIRLARSVNRAVRRSGRVWADRYHRHDLTTPREVRDAIVYVLNNVKKHRPGLAGLDPCSSAAWFTDWHDRGPVMPAGIEEPVLSPRTWLLGAGWRRAGSVRIEDIPVSP